MSALKTILAGGVVAVALVSAAPASAQYYPGYGSPYGYGGGDVIGQVLGQVLTGGYGNPYGGYGGGYGINSQAAVSQCVGAVQQRLNASYGGNGYGNYGNYGYNGYGRARVLGISRVEQRNGGGLNVRGVANSGRYLGTSYGGQTPVDLTFTCRTDFRGYITDVDVDRAQTNYGYNYSPYNNGYAPYGGGYAPNSGYAPYGSDYSQYGYSRY